MGYDFQKKHDELFIIYREVVNGRGENVWETVGTLQPDFDGWNFRPSTYRYCLSPIELDQISAKLRELNNGK